MKKFITLILLGLMILLISGIAVAENNNGSIYLDYLVSGQGSIDLVFNRISGSGFSYTLKPSEYALGVDYAFANFVMGGEYVTGSSDVTGSGPVTIDPSIDYTDFNYYKINAGYRIINNGQFILDFYGSYYNIHSSDKTGSSLYNNYSINGFVIGTKVGCNFSEKASISLNYGTSLTAAPTSSFEAAMPVPSSKSGSFSAYDVKFNYLITENFGVTVGYRSFTAKATYDYTAFETIIEVNNTMSGYTLGINYKF